MKKIYFILLLIIIIAGLMLRVYHLDFGLPHSFYADEPEIAELAIKYTFEIKNIIKNKDYYQLIPISFVYGTLPAYFSTIAVMLFSKIMNLLHVGFDKTTLYIYLRSFYAFFSLVLLYPVYMLGKKLLNDNLAAVITLILISMNWKLIVHAHYVNADILLVLLLALSYLSLYFYYKNKGDTKYTILTGILLGAAIGTKITAMISLPLYLAIFLVKKDLKGLAAFILVILGTFILTNPFSLAFANNFAFRIYSMLFKEGGLVFDSVDSNPLKYLSALVVMVNPIVTIFGIYGFYLGLKSKKDLPFQIFLLAQVALYLIFFSIQSRRVDRWLLPVLPIMFIYAAFGISKLKDKVNKPSFIFIMLIVSTYYLYYPFLLLDQFRRYTPKSEAYLWARDNLPADKNKLVYTEEGLDPMNKLLGTRVFKIPVYSSENAQFFMPENPEGYDYIILSSRPMSNYKRPEVKKAYPFYHDRWGVFEDKVLDENNFSLIKQFVLPKPNLIPLSDVFIYKNLNPITPIIK